MKIRIFAGIAFCLSLFIPQPGRAAFGDRITVSGTQFKAGSDPIWINGANTPWHIWNEFGGRFDAAWWDQHFEQLHKNGINATRVWISCSGEIGINIDPTGHVSGCTATFWKNVDSLFQLARKRQIYIAATLMSYDHFSKVHRYCMNWRNMFANNGNIDSMVTNYILPFAVRYRDNPWLWSIDLCNEPDWIHETTICGKLRLDCIQTYVAKAAAAIHTNTPILVTVGLCMGPKYTARFPGTNILSDAALQACNEGITQARIDFYTPHYYDWMLNIRGNPFYETPDNYGLDSSKPVVIGECPAKGSAHHTITDDYESAYSHGWQGVMAWSSNGVDENGSLADFNPATKDIQANHNVLIFPR